VLRSFKTVENYADCDPTTCDASPYPTPSWGLYSVCLEPKNDANMSGCDKQVCQSAEKEQVVLARVKTRFVQNRDPPVRVVDDELSGGRASQPAQQRAHDSLLRRGMWAWSYGGWGWGLAQSARVQVSLTRTVKDHFDRDAARPSRPHRSKHRCNDSFRAILSSAVWSSLRRRRIAECRGVYRRSCQLPPTQGFFGAASKNWGNL